MQPFAIAPSILSADFARLGEEVDNVLAAGADIVHFDVMDNHYVPNLTIGPMVCAALRKYGITAPIDAHLMVSPVDRIIGDFIEAGATYITFHPEATQHVDRSLQLIREGGCKAGLVFNPATPLDVLKYVMDNHYVPNLTIGPMVCSALRKYGVTAPIDVHLMVSPVDRIIGDFIEAGATFITFHPEATQHIDRSLQLIREGGCKAGLVFNPATPLDVLKYVMDKVDMVLLMSVNPGFGGQKFIPGTLNKLREARALIDASGRDIRLEIDGGVNVANIREIAEAGADTFVAGSAIFNTPNYEEVIQKMRAELALARP